MAHTQNTIYTTLKNHQWEIRILVLLPGEWHDPITCHVKTVSLHDKPEFDAISYVWGDEKDRQLIHVNNHDMLVTTNLYLALRRLRKSSKPYNLWVDAICIDQSNIHEKNHQVSLMGDIYCHSRETTVWLGEETGAPPSLAESSFIDKVEMALLARERGDHTPFSLFMDTEANHILEGVLSEEAAWPILREQIQQAKYLESVAVTRFNAFLFVTLLARGAHASDVFGKELSPPKAASSTGVGMAVMMCALRLLVCNPWWQRAWVVQEIVLSPKSKLQYGAHSIPWPLFVMAGNRLLVHFGSCCYEAYRVLCSPYLQLFNDFRRNIEEVFTVHIKWLAKQLTLRDLLQRLRNRKATLAVDKIFSVLSLQDRNQKFLDLIPDYRVSATELYRKVTEWEIESSNDLSILENCTGELKPGFPSWVPDWTMPLGSPSRTMAINDRLNVMSLYSADGQRRCKNTVLHNRILAIEGVPFDEVTRVFESTNGTLQYLKDMCHWVKTHTKERYHTGCSREDAFMRTITGDCIFESESPEIEWEPKQPRVRRLSAEDMENINAFWEFISDTIGKGLSGSSLFEHSEQHKRFEDLRTSIYVNSADRRFFLTKEGYMGFGPKTMGEGDQVFTLLGGRTPFILRPHPIISSHSLDSILTLQVPGDITYGNVGPCFVHGIMDGEVIGARESEITNIYLV